MMGLEGTVLLDAFWTMLQNKKSQTLKKKNRKQTEIQYQIKLDERGLRKRKKRLIQPEQQHPI
jgi:hypothetical protein